ncbi:uncharacterized protein LOC129260565 [Lytechinus pictus]|uniref:uncharacterized protein LOC129260565 n=1 Tax=Lytechinus pictus TaxID=7653 RepID=UPI0030B9CC55
MATQSGLKVVLFLGTCREGRVGIRVANFMINQLKARGHDVHFMDAQELNLPILTKPLHFYTDQTQAPAILQEAKTKIVAADCYVVVSGEYNHSIPPGLSNLFDYFPASIFSYKPSGIVCYSPGPYGGMRAAIQLRAFLGEMGCISVSNIFGIPNVGNAISKEGKPLNEYMEKGAEKLLAQLDWMAEAMKAKREKEFTS